MQRLGRNPVKSLQHGAQQIVLHICSEHSCGTKHTGHYGRHHSTYAQNARHIHRMHRTAPAKCDQREVARITATLHRHGANRPRHVDIGDLADAVRGGVQIKAQRHAYVPGDRLSRRLKVYRQTSPGQGNGIQKTEHHVGIRHRGTVVAELVAGRAGTRAHRFGAHVQQPAGVHAGNRATAGADFSDVDRRHFEHVPAALDEAAGR